MSSEHEVAPGFAWPRYSRILVALGHTSVGAFALRHAVPYAVDQRSQVTLLSVVPKVRVLVPTPGFPPDVLAAEMENETAARLRRTAATLPDEISVTTLLRHGDPAKEILAVAHERQVDVICLGARGRGRIAGALLGSVSSAVLRDSPVPVVVWHPPREEREVVLRPAWAP
jgi:nucleotide-binding universal stress UspA family protein